MEQAVQFANDEGAEPTGDVLPFLSSVAYNAFRQTLHKREEVLP